ncbi:MAG: DUF2807 domain-containing protein [Prevotella sp.]|nr:DUF2807 domain-containing protein [Prevotella sp.]
MKAKKSLMASLLVLVLAQTIVSCVSCVSCGRKSIEIFDEGPEVTQIRPLKGFEKIEILGSPTVYYTQADTFSVRIEGPENLVNNILTSVDDGTLFIRNRGKIGMVNINFGNMNDLSVHVTSPDLVSVLLSGSGDFISQKHIDTDEMSIVLRGSGDMTFNDILCDHCTTELTGSGDVDIQRLEAITSSVTLIGSGDVELFQCNVQETDITLRGSGDIDVRFDGDCKKVDCQLVGSGDISLRGKVRQYSQQKSGSGDIDTDKLMIEK